MSRVSGLLGRTPWMRCRRIVSEGHARAVDDLLSGSGLARELLKIRSTVPIILCTGFSVMITEERAKAIGIGALVIKPALTGTMAETI